MLVFKNKRYIYHANEYQRYGHYDITDDDQLFTLYVKELNDGLLQTKKWKKCHILAMNMCKKKYFLENYFILQFHYLPTWYESTRFKEMYQNAKNTVSIPMWCLSLLCRFTRDCWSGEISTRKILKNHWKIWRTIINFFDALSQRKFRRKIWSNSWVRLCFYLLLE